ncbi:three component ABC system middle component [Streptomyces sp. AC495_CC817]|uniref:three component ABC system middle component n=1 Tax=Streptomyces sp. AC495_CC817 TaxID=2823900 RepID=UPI001C259C4D|nr:three component ABC system middle component [Streptomyces sp. AC495_CC817]
MPSWSQRPQASAAFLNPALVAAVAATAARAYEREASGRLMPWPMAFVVAPLVLHRPTRQALPTSTRTHLTKWVADHPALVAGLAARSTSLAPSVREGLRFGLRHQMLTIEQGYLRGRIPSTSRIEGELAQLIKAASLIGRWTAKSDNPSTVFALLGVRP